MQHIQTLISQRNQKIIVVVQEEAHQEVLQVEIVEVATIVEIAETVETSQEEVLQVVHLMKEDLQEEIHQGVLQVVEKALEENQQNRRYKLERN